MQSNSKYMRIFKIAGIELNEADKICKVLSEDTLNRITKIGLDRRLILPIINRTSGMINGICDNNVNAILDDQNIIIQMMGIYCR